jgi:hypothetical protein
VIQITSRPRDHHILSICTLHTRLASSTTHPTTACAHPWPTSPVAHRQLATSPFWPRLQPFLTNVYSKSPESDTGSFVMSSMLESTLYSPTSSATQLLHLLQHFHHLRLSSVAGYQILVRSPLSATGNRSQNSRNLTHLSPRTPRQPCLKVPHKDILLFVCTPC